MEKHDGDEGPLWSFMDDVCVGEPVVIRKNKVIYKLKIYFMFVEVDIHKTIGGRNLHQAGVRNHAIVIISKLGE